MTFQAIRGTRDILPGEVEHWQRVEAVARDVFALYGFREMRTPIFEDSAVFLKGTGETTDIVQKEMYRFEDLGGNDITLRPEGTPPVVRAYLEHGLSQGRSIDRYYYIGPMFRYERPQKGRYRQFHQVGVEALGSESPRIDAEVIEMAMRWLRRIGVADARLVVNTVGDEVSRVAYRDALIAAQAERLDELCEDCRRRHRTNPLRVLDCKVRSCQPVIAAMPVIQDHLSDRSAAHFAALQEALAASKVRFEIDPRMVRGLDYYRETVFEVTSERLGAQDSILGGGRYDGLVAAMGGEDVPGIGFASGVERILLALGDLDKGSDSEAFVVGFDDSVTARVHEAVHRLRGAGVRALCAAYDGRSKKAQSKAARRSEAAWQLVIGPDEVAADRYTLRNVVDERRVESTWETLDAVFGEAIAAARQQRDRGSSDR